MPQPATDRLGRYRAKRDFDKTPEPRGEQKRAGRALSFVIQKHDATRLHYDFRLEFDGVLLSWAVPKGPSFDPKDKRMAVRTEDHPLSYGTFEGSIPKGQYGGGDVIVWDRGTWVPLNDPEQGLAAGKLAFELKGEKLAGTWELVRMKPGERQEVWLLFKKRDDHARSRDEYDVVAELPLSVITGQGLPGDAGGAKGRTPTRSAAKASSMKPAAAAAAKKTKPASQAVSTRKAPRAPAAKTAAATRAALPDGAVKAPLPETLAPQLATLASDVPVTGEWRYEVKYDGYRVMTRIERGVPAFITRGGHDWTDRLPKLAEAVSALGVRSGWLDGELVVLNAEGVPDFNALQKSFDRSRTEQIVYFVFDLPFFEGADLRAVPLVQRRAVLESLMATRANEHVRLSVDLDADPRSILKSACAMHLEGVIAKRADAPYTSRRSTAWLKLKCQRRQEFVIAGFTARSNDPDGVGSLLLGVHDEAGRLVSVGSVGTGWDTATSRSLYTLLSKAEVPHSPFGGPDARAPGRWSRRGAGLERWVKPQKVAEVSFAEWTPDGQVRHAVFVSLRTDKPARAITRERESTAEVVATAGQATDKPARKATSRQAAPKTATAATPARAKAAASKPSPPAAKKASPALKISHPERVIDAKSGVTKLDLAMYYDAVSEWILPHLKGRPCSLVRGPAGVAGELFFQKHADRMRIGGIKELPVSVWPEHAALLEVNTRAALAGCSQMNVIEFHTWNAHSRTVDRPDRIVFDLDPGEGVSWAMVQDAAKLTRSLLDALGLKSWLKTSGGKGLHVVVPLAPRLDWDTVKGFSQAVVQHMARHIPQRFVAKSGPSNRVGKIFVDYLRNGHGATTAAAFSARARPGLGVSMPVHWDQLDALESGAQWTVLTALEHLSRRGADPWADQAGTRQALGPAIKRLAAAD